MAGPWLVMRLSTTALWVRVECLSTAEVRASMLRVAEPSETEWEDGAVVPASGWHDVRDRFGAPCSDELAFRPGRDVAVIEMTAQLAASGPEHAIASVGTVDDYFGVRRDEPGLVTTTRNRGSGRLVGLHLDNWDRLPAGRRGVSRNRVNVNLGSEQRIFMFADLDIADACCSLGQRQGARHASALGRFAPPTGGSGL